MDRPEVLIMTKKEILNYLELITDELTDAYHLTDREGSEEAFCSIDTARELIEELTNNCDPINSNSNENTNSI